LVVVARKNQQGEGMSDQKPRRGKRGVAGQIIGGVLTQDAWYSETEKGAVMELHIDVHETDREGFILRTKKYVGKIWNDGARKQHVTGEYVRNAYVGFVCAEPKLDAAYKDRPARVVLDMGSSPANLWINPAGRATLSVRPVAAKDVPTPAPPPKIDTSPTAKNGAYEIPF
jgi:hypothetical protein